MPAGTLSRLLAMILLLVAVGGVYLLVVVPLIDCYEARQTLLEQRRMLALRLAAVAAELPVLRARVGELRAAASANGAGFEGENGAIATANLQSRVKEVAGSVGATIGSSEDLPAEPRGTYRRIGIRVGLDDKYETVVELLAALEMATPPLVIGSLHIRGVRKRVFDSEPSRLDTDIEIYAFRDGDTSPAPTGPPSGPAPIAVPTVAPAPDAAAAPATFAPETSPAGTMTTATSATRDPRQTRLSP